MIDPRAKQFLQEHGTGPIEQVAGGETRAAKEAQRLAAYRQEAYIKRAGQFAEELIAFFVQQKEKYDFTDDECVGGVALLAINLRYSYGEPQNDAEKEVWDDTQRDARYAEFDRICEAMQEYADEEYSK